MKTETDQVIVEDNNSDADVNGLDLEVNTEATDDAENVVSDGATEPKKSDAEVAKVSFKLREEKRARKALEDEVATLKAQREVPTTEKPEVPNFDDYGTTAEYNTAMADYQDKLVDWKFEQRDVIAKSKSAHDKHYDSLKELDSKFLEQVDSAVEKYPDFMEVDTEVRQHLNDVTIEAILRSENSAEVLYYLGKNPESLDSLQGASPIAVANEIHKIDVKVKGTGKKVVSDAPAPIDPIKDGDDILKKDPSKMTMDEYMAYDKAKTIAKYKKKLETGML